MPPQERGFPRKQEGEFHPQRKLRPGPSAARPAAGPLLIRAGSERQGGGAPLSPWRVVSVGAGLPGRMT